MWVLCDKKVPKKQTILIYKTVIRPVVLCGAETWPLTDYLADWFGVCKNENAALLSRNQP